MTRSWVLDLNMNETGWFKMANKIKNNHYVATHRPGVDSPSSGAYLHRASSRDENDSHRAPSERTLSEYTVSFFFIS